MAVYVRVTTDKSRVFGREADQEKLLSKLLGDDAYNQNVSIISIVGLGGVGKTTLTQLLYNNENVKAQFELKVWVCVSDEFDVLTISNKIYEVVTGENKNFVNFDQLHLALQEKLSNKRFLLVLDNVWIEDQDKWEVLEKPLKGAPGRLPLALIAIGRVLKGKGSDEYEWDRLLKSEIWSSNDSILLALKLSYYDLPSQLKQLFAYCCLFPKDYEFNKKELVLLWMAEGFLNHPNGNMSMESVGFEYFEELQARSFFQQHSAGHKYMEPKYTMHDLMNDLTISVAGDFFYFLDAKMDVNGRNKAFEKLRHFSYLGRRGAENGKLEELRRSEHLRTLLMVLVRSPYYTLENFLVDIFPQLQFLRVLSLTQDSIRYVPRSIGALKHLRYLNFSGSPIQQVPKEVSELYNLQSLLVSHCRWLTSLPTSFHKLIKLRHLDMTNTPLLKKTPSGMVGLTSLQTLSKVIIERANGFKVSDLNNMSNLQGELFIEGVEEVTDPQQAMDANLEGKKGLVSLDMEWSDVFDESQNSVLEYEVFQMLKPPSKLNRLNISNYGGMKFPSWFVGPSFDKLTLLIIIDCPNLVELSTGVISTLEYLNISFCKKLVSIGENEINAGSSNRKSPLREVRLCGCDSLESYICANTVEKLCIEDFDSMTSVTMSTTLQELPTSLKSLAVHRCKNLKSLFYEQLQSLTSLEEMRIIKCESMDDSFPCGLWL
ncbi:putative disease resistance RPP13-like protein 1 [Rutidosis leptorrhynchoides]|uniref:putative disease resistance RPP13-like protein 1 n=1 Tax=Rutidosis leptorrhynchoides TaxID=125765 RepID=UPI003A99CE9B